MKCLNISRTISSLRATKYQSEYLNIDFWLEKETSEEIAIFKCKHCRKFKQFFLKDLKGIGDWNLKNFDERINQIQKQILTFKFLKISDLPNFAFNKTSKNFWLFRGFTEQESKEKLFLFQQTNAKKCYEKYSKEEIREKREICEEYWIKRGFSKDESKEKIRERQSTFSLEKCILKFGEVEGTKVWKERQERWQKSLNENNDMEEVNSRKDSGSLNYYISKYGDSEEAIKRYKENCYNLGTAQRNKPRSISERNSISRGISEQYQKRRISEGTDYFGIVYFLHFKELKSVKIGLTSGKSYRFNSLEKTFGKFEILHIIETDKCFETEKFYHQLFSSYSSPLNEFRINGFTEFFSEDIIPLINSNIKINKESIL